LLLGNLQPLATPDALDPFMVHRPSLGAEKCRYPTITVPAVLPGQTDDVAGQCLFIGRDDQLTALRRSRLTKISTGTPFRETKLLADTDNASTATLGA
jgi:hypothetical protein